VIPPVDKRVSDEFEDDDIFRPEWMKWYYHRYQAATQLMDPEQKGWYMNLLMYAAIQGDPPGHLPEEDDELRYIAGVKDLAALAYDLYGGYVEVQPKAIEKQNRRWLRVLSKFRQSSEFPGTIYNKTLVNTLKEAKRKSKFTALAAKSMQNSRKIKRQEERELAANAQQPESRRSADALSISFLGLNGSIETKESLEVKPQKELGLSLTEEEPNTLDTKVESIIPENNEISTSIESQNEGTQTNQTKSDEEKGSVSVKRKRSPESFFDEAKWSVTPKMAAYLLTKYESEGIAQGDIDYFATKFPLVHHNSKYSSWTRAFYNFVDNQLTKYDYSFGDYKRRGRKSNEQKSITAGEQRPGLKPWERLESTADRNARLEREADEHIRRLRSGGGGDHSQGATGLSLTADDLG